MTSTPSAIRGGLRVDAFPHKRQLGIVVVRDTCAVTLATRPLVEPMPASPEDLDLLHEAMQGFEFSRVSFCAQLARTRDRWAPPRHSHRGQDRCRSSLVSLN